MKKPFSFLNPGINRLILLIIFVLISGNCLAQNADSLLYEGIKLRNQDKLEESLQVLKKAAKIDEENPEILFQTALTHAEIGIGWNRLYDRIFASDLFEELLRKYPKNEKYLMAYAKLKDWQGYTWNAEKIYENLIKNKTESDTAYMELAKIIMEKTEWLRDLYDPEGAIKAGTYIKDEWHNQAGVISFEKWYKNYFVKADTLLNKAKEINPDNPEIYYKLGILYLEDKNWDKLLDLFRSAISKKPDFKDAHLMLGYTFYRKKNFDSAAYYFDKAKLLMNVDEYSIMESFNKVFENESKNLPENYLMAINPIYMYRHNLRQLEHYSRVAYSNLKFGFPELYVEGWQTDRGKVYIRYGEPLELHKMPWGEYWDYKIFSFYFTGNIMFKNRKMSSIQYYQDIVKQMPEFWGTTYPDPDMRVDFSYYTAAFKGEEGLTDVEIYYTIPVGNVKAERKKGIKKFICDQGVYIFDSNWNELSRVENKVQMPADKDINYGVEFRLRPGKYNLAFEVWEKHNAFFGQYKLPAEIPVIKDSLFVSDIILGVPEKDESIFRGRAALFDIFPRASFEFNENMLKAYLEVYNLTLKNKKTNFTVNLSVSSVREDKNILSRIFRFFTGKKETVRIKETIITSSYKYSGSSAEDYVVNEIDISKLKTGMYLLSYEVIDDISGKVSSSERMFTRKFKAQIAEGLERRDSLKIDESLDILEKEEKEEKEDPELFYEIAKTHLKKNDIRSRETAEKYFEKAVRLDKKNEKYLMSLAGIKVIRGFKKDALKLYEEILELNPENTDVFFKISDIYIMEAISLKQKGRYDKKYRDFIGEKFKKAEAMLNKGLEIDPGNRDIIKKLGSIYTENEQFENLERLFSDALNKDSNFKEAHLYLAYAYYQMDDLDKAEVEFEKAKGLMSGEEIMSTGSFMKVFEFIGKRRLMRKKIEEAAGYKYFNMNMYFYYAAFKGTEKPVNFEVYYKVPVNRLHKKMLGNRQKVSISRKGYLLNEFGDLIDGAVDRIDIPTSFIPLDITSVLKVKVDPGRYYLELDFVDVDSTFYTWGQSFVQLHDFNKSPSVSDVILGEKIDIRGNISGKINIRPEPALIFEKDTVSAYFEIYNLKQKNEKTAYTLKTEIIELEQDEEISSMSKKEISKLFEKRPTVLSGVSEYNGSSRDDNKLISLNISALDAGSYLLRIEVFDKNNKKSAETFRCFKVR